MTLIGRDGQPLASESDDGALRYLTAPEGGIAGPPVEQFRITPRPHGLELRVTNPRGIAMIKRANLAEFIKSLVVLAVKDQRDIVSAEFERFLAERDAPSQNGSEHGFSEPQDR